VADWRLGWSKVNERGRFDGGSCDKYTTKSPPGKEQKSLLPEILRDAGSRERLVQ